MGEEADADDTSATKVALLHQVVAGIQVQLRKINARIDELERELAEDVDDGGGEDDVEEDEEEGEGAEEAQ